MDLERLCSQDFNNFIGSLVTTRATVKPAQNQLTGWSREPIVPNPQYCESGQLPDPTERTLRNDSKEPIGATRSQYAEPLPVRLVDTTLEFDYLLLE